MRKKIGFLKHRFDIQYFCNVDAIRTDDSQNTPQTRKSIKDFTTNYGMQRKIANMIKQAKQTASGYSHYRRRSAVKSKRKFCSGETATESALMAYTGLDAAIYKKRTMVMLFQIG